MRESPSVATGHSARIIYASELGYRKNNSLLWSNLNFAVAAGELWYITGANGSGKSTLLRLLAGLLRDFSGSLQVNADCRIYCGHQSGNKLSLTVRENLLSICSQYGLAGTYIDQVLAETALTEYANQPLGQLSAGQRQRIALAGLRLIPAQLWLLDEPWISLDGEGSRLLEKWIAEHTRQGGAVVIARPAVDEAQTGLQLAKADSISGDSQSRQFSVESGQQFESLPADWLLWNWRRLLGSMRHDLALLLAQPSGLLRMPLLFLLGALLLHLGEGDSISALSEVAAGSLWALALIILLSAGDLLCRGDREDGTMEQQLIPVTGAMAAVIARIAALWLVIVMPLAFCAPFAGLLLGLKFESAGLLGIGILIAGLGIAAVGAAGSALVAPLQGSGLLLPLLTLPMVLPYLIFGVAAAEVSLGGQNPLPLLALLLAFSLAAVALLPIAVATLWRLAIEY